MRRNFVSLIWRHAFIPVKSRRSGLHIVLALLLLLMQPAGFVHALSHYSAERQSGAAHDKQLPVGDACEQCLAYAQLGSGLTSSFLLELPAALPEARPPVVGPAYLAFHRFHAFLSRAPPAAS